MTTRQGFTVAGQVIGGAIGGMYGQPQLGAAAGGLLGSAIGGAVERMDAAPRPEAGKVQLAHYGTPFYKLYGHPRSAGHLIWAAPLEEAPALENTDGGKGGGSGPADNPNTEWQATFAVGLSETQVRGIRRIWANGVLVHDETVLADTPGALRLNYTLYTGTETQLPDATIEALEGAGMVPAYRGLAYVVIHDMRLGPFGNQIPTLEFEVLAAGQWAVGEFESQDAVAVAAPINWRHLLYDAAGNLIMLGGNEGTHSQYRVVNPRTWEVVSSGVLSTAIGGNKLRDAIYIADQNTVWVVHIDGDLFTHITEFDATSFAQLSDVSLGWVPVGVPGAYLAYDPYFPALNIIRDSHLPTQAVQRYDLSTRTLGKSNTAMENGTGITGGGRHVQLWHYLGFIQVRSVTPPEANSQNWQSVDLGLEGILSIDSSGEASAPWLPAATVTLPGTLAASFSCWDPARGLYFVHTGTGHLYTITDAPTPVVTQVASGVPGADAQGRVLFSAAMNAYLSIGNSGLVRVFDADSHALLLNGEVGALGPTNLMAARLSATDPGAIIIAGAYGEAYPRRLGEVALYTTTVGDAVASLLRASGYADVDFDVSELTQRLHGFRVTAQAPVRPALEQLAAVYFFEGCEEDDKLVFKRRGRPVVATYSADDCIVADPAALPINSRRAAENELPKALDLAYPDSAQDYQPGNQLAQRQASTRGEERAMAVDVVGSPTAMRRVADALLFDAWHARDTASATLPIAAARLTQGDTLTLAGRRYRVLGRRIENLAAGLDLVADDASIALQYAQGATAAFKTQAPPMSAALEFTLLRAPLLRDEDDTWGDYWAHWARASYMGADLLGGFSFEANPASVPATLLARSETPAATAGTALNTLGATALPWQLDQANQVHVRFANGVPASITHDELQAGGNHAMVGRELIQFQTATLQADGTWRLAGLLRGRRGTEWACSQHVPGERVVLLSAATTNTYTGTASVHGAQGYYRCFAITAHAQVVPRVQQQEVLDYRLRPLAPVDVVCNKDAGAAGAWPITWARRSRRASSLAGPLGVQVPLGEEVERYLLQILHTDNTLAREVVVEPLPYYAYPAALRTADHGSPTAPFKVRIYQISARVGAGLPSEVITL